MSDSYTTAGHRRPSVEATELVWLIMQNANINQTQLAAKMGVRQGTISKRISGDHDVRLDKLAETLSALGYRLRLNAEPIHHAS